MTNYPLSWPDGWKRQKYRKDAMFYRESMGQFGKKKDKLSIADGVERVCYELGRLGISANNAIISTNVQPRLDGMPRSNQSEPADPGVAVYWKSKGRNQVMAVDRYTRVADNLAAIAATLEAMRAIERHGGAQILDRAFLGFQALPAPVNWRHVLQVAPEITGSTALMVAREAYKTLAKIHHPDLGGSSEKMAELNRAMSDAEREVQP